MKKLYLYKPKNPAQFVFIILLIGTPFFFLGGPGYHGSRSFVALWNLGHVLFFALTAWLLCKLFRYWYSQVSLFAVQLYVFLTILITGIAVELLQMGFDGRSPDTYDIFRNQLGCLITLAFCCSSKMKWQRGVLSVFRFFVFIFIGIALYPLSCAVIDEVIALRQFPLLSDFETIFEIDRWKDEELLAVEEGIARHGQNSLKVQLTTETYSGVSLFYFNGNWQDYSKLHVSVYLPEEGQLKLVCRIHDAEHNDEYSDRFNRRFLLKHGWNDLLISLDDVQNAPVKRLMNLGKIESLGFFVVRQKSEKVVYIDRVYLE